MTSRKKKIVNTVFLLLVFLLTVYSVFRGEDLHEVVREIMRVNPWYLLPGVFGVVFLSGVSPLLFITCLERWIFMRKMDLFSVFMCGILFQRHNAVCERGQPMQIYYMRKHKIPVPVSTLVLMIVTITYKLVLVGVGLFVAFFQRGFVSRYLEGILPVFIWECF